MTDYTPTTDWRQIDTSADDGCRQLGIEIAKRLGWTVRHDGVYWSPYAPDGTRKRGVAETEVLAWGVAFNAWWNDPPLILDWPNDLNAAFNLLLTSGAFWSMDGGGASNISSIRMYDGEFNDVREYGDTDKLALLICKAWLAFDDQRIEG